MYTVGSQIPLHFTLVDPRTLAKVSATVAVSVEDPDGESTSPTVTEDATGEYSASFTPSEPGRYVVTWVATGDTQVTYSDIVNVAPATPPGLISLAEARQYLNIPAGERVDDDELRGFIAAATAAVERHLGEVVARRSVTEYYDVFPARRRLYLRSIPVLAVTSIESIDGDAAWNPDDLLVDGPTGMIDTLGSDPLCGHLKIVYTAGYRVVPPNVILAAQIIVGHLWETQRVQSIGQPPGFGEEAPGATFGLGFALPNRAVELLGGTPPVIA